MTNDQAPMTNGTAPWSLGFGHWSFRVANANYTLTFLRVRRMARCGCRIFAAILECAGGSGREIAGKTLRRRPAGRLFEVTTGTWLGLSAAEAPADLPWRPQTPPQPPSSRDMTLAPRTLALLGSTGSIGQSTLEVVRHSQGAFKVAALSAHRKFDLLCQQAAEFHPRYVVASDGGDADGFDWSGLPPGTELVRGSRGMAQVVSLPEIDVVVAAVVGSAGLTGTWAALEAGKTVALANKETLVMAGPLVMQLAAERNAKILPVDSEHSAVFQLLEGHRSPHAPREEILSRSEMATVGGNITRSVMATVGGNISRSEMATVLQRIILTASGGPFRSWPLADMEAATVA